MDGSIGEFGWAKRFLIVAGNGVICGRGCLKAAEQRGRDPVPAGGAQVTADDPGQPDERQGRPVQCPACRRAFRA